MKLRHSVKWMLVGALVVPQLTACSFGGEGEEEEEVEVSEEGDAAEVEGEEGENVAVEGAEDNVSAEGNITNGTEGNVAFEDANANAMGTEGVDNAMAGNEIPPELLNSQNDVAGAEGMGAEGMGAEGMGAEGMGAEGMPVADGTEAMPTDAAPVDNTAGMVPEAAPAMAAPGDARVYFISVDSAALYSGADASSSSVGSLTKGEPVLVKIEGNWANVINRGYIEVANLSQTPVGRSVGAKSWR